MKATQKIFRNLTILFSGSFFIHGILKRDYRLQNVLTNNETLGEFETSMLLCGDLPRCFRITGHGIGFMLENLNAFLFTKIFSFNEFHTSYISPSEQIFIINRITSLEFRILMLSPILYFIFKDTKQAKQFIMTLIALGSIISGYPLVYIDRFFDMYLTVPDYMAIFILGLYLNFYSKIHAHKFLLIVFLFLCAMSYENLALAIGIAELMNRNKAFLQRIKFLVSTVLVTLAWVFIYLLSYNFLFELPSLTFADAEFYRKSNFSHLHLLIPAIFILFFWTIILGIIAGPGYKQLDSLNYLDRRFRLFIGLLSTYALAIFTSGIDAEGARQMLPGQLLLFAMIYQHKVGTEKVKQL